MGGRLIVRMVVWIDGCWVTGLICDKLDGWLDVWMVGLMGDWVDG